MWESFYLVCVLECVLELHLYWEGIQERIGKNLGVTYIEKDCRQLLAKGEVMIKIYE